MDKQSNRSAKQLLDAAMAKQAATPGQQALLERLKQLGIIGAGVGATYGVARGLHGMTKKPPSLGSGSNVPAPLPISTVRPTEEEELRPQFKMAAGLQDAIAGMLPEPNNADVRTGNGIPLSFAAAAIPGVAAYKGVRGLFDRHRKAQQEAALAMAKKDYEKSLADQYRSVVTQKTAADKDLAADIDSLFDKQATQKPDAYQKFMSLIPGLNPVNLYGSTAVGATNGALGNNPVEGFNSLRGLTNLLMGGGAIATGKYMYDRSLKTSPDKVMQEALKRRSRQRRSVPNVLTPQLMAESE